MRFLSPVRCAVVAVVCLLLVPAVSRGQAGGEATKAEVPLFTNLGDHTYAISTRVPAAQRYFAQGLRLYYAFNHAEAIRSFGEAQRLDPECAMCWWGEALAHGPNINAAMDSASELAAYGAVEEALARRADATEKERALIEALAVRYSETAASEERASRDSAYARAIGELARRYPDDDEIAVFHAESLMDLRPWDYWTEDGELVPGMVQAVERLEEVIESNPAHPGACHFYIHAVEEVHPEWAVPCAERLASLMPGAGHLVHMPGHIYIRVGRYADAIRANEHAVHADETYIRDVRPGFGFYTAGYYPHNYDFLAFAAAMAGSAGQAIESADGLALLIPEEMVGAPGFGFLEHWMTRGLQMRIRFARWDEILAKPLPREGLGHARAMTEYARGRALLAKRDVSGAAAALARVEEAAADPALAQLRLEFNPAQSVLGIAAKVLEGEIAAARGDVAAATRAYREAVAREDALTYGEPPEWSIPVRQEMGAMLLRVGRAAEAERIFREDLERFPDNGWSLYGLAEALGVQGRGAEAEQVRSRFREAWLGEGPPPTF